MKRNLFFLSLAFVLCLSVTTLQAASVSLIPSDVDVAPGDIFMLSIEFDVSDTVATFLGGSLDINFNDATYNYQSYSWDPTFFAATDPLFTLDPMIGSGALTNWVFGNFSGLPLSGNIGSVSFQLDSAVSIGAILDDITVSLTADQTYGEWNGIDALGATLDFTPDFAAASVNAVPIPGALLLLGSGLIGLVGLRKKVS